MNTQHIPALFLSLILGACMVSAPLVVSAETTVVNQTSSSANSGGNTAEGGQVVEGETETQVTVYTEVNGEVVEDYQETSSDPIEYESSYEGEGIKLDQSASAGASVEVATDETGTTTTTDDSDTSAQVSASSTVVKDANVFARVFTSIQTTITNIFAYVFNLL